MLLLFGTALMVLVLIGCAIAISQPDASMPEVERDAPDIGLPDDRPMTADDVDRLRFSLAWRGYRMADVDQALDRLRVELASRDARISRLKSDAAAGAPPSVDSEDPRAPDSPLSAPPHGSDSGPPASWPDIAPPG